MAAYNITLSDGTSITVGDGVILNTYSIPIVGQNAPSYGDDVAAAFLRSLENFSYTLPPDTNPNIPGSVKLTGQLWYDAGTQALNVYDGAAWNTLLTADTGLDSIAADIIPATDSTYDVGAIAKRWQDMYTDNLTFGGTVTGEAGSNVAFSGTFTADGASTVDLNGTVTIAGATMDGKLNLSDPDVTSAASLNLAEAAGAPGGGTSVGDMWLEADGVHVIINSGSPTEVTLAAVGPSSGVTSFDGRSGSVVPWASDYEDRYPTLADFTGLGTGPTASATSTIQASAIWVFQNSPQFTNATPFTVQPGANKVTNLDADKLDGQDITYFATSAEVVKLTGTQNNIDGDKTFTNKVRINSDDSQALRIIGSSTGSANQGYISFYESNDSVEVMRIGEDSGSLNFSFDYLRTGSVTHEYGGQSRISLLAGTTGASAVSLYGGSNVLALQTIDSTAAAQRSTNVLVSSYSGSVHSAGYNETPTQTIAGTFVLSNSYIGKFLTRSATTTTTVELPANSDMAIGSSALIHNDNSTNTLTVIGDGTSVIEWVDGSGTTPLTGTRTIAYNGIATVRRKGSTTWQIWGNGIS